MLRMTKIFCADRIAGILNVRGWVRLEVGRGLMAVAMLGGLVSGGAVAAKAQGQGKLAAAPPVTYANRYELYGGLNFMNFQAGQNLPKRMNMGGGEISGTYWLKPKLGLVADYRGEAGTTPVFSNVYEKTRSPAPQTMLFQSPSRNRWPSRR